MSAASVDLLHSPSERPCENTVDRDALLSELNSDATDFLGRPADQERYLVHRRSGGFECWLSIGPMTDDSHHGESKHDE